MRKEIPRQTPKDTPESCAAWTARLLALQANTLPEAERQGVQAHLAECHACAQALRGYQEVAHLMQQLPEYTLPPDLPPKLLRAWEKAEKEQDSNSVGEAARRDARSTGALAPTKTPAPKPPATRPTNGTHWGWPAAAVLMVLVVIGASLFGLIASGRHNRPASGSPGSVPRWAQLHPIGGPPAPRGPGSNGAVGYDVAHNRLIFFGGVTTAGVSLNDTWVLVNADGTTGTPQWVQLATANTPAPHKGQAGAYDAVTNRLIIYGGCLGQCAPLDDQVYVLTHANGLGGTPTWQQLQPTGKPPPSRTSFTAVYDPASNRLMVFGGDNGFGGRYNDIWVLTHANGLGGIPTWTPLAPSDDPPPAREGHAALYDAVNNRMVIFGGNSRSSSWLNETWVLTNANGLGGAPVWSQLTQGSAVPAARVAPVLVYDQVSDQAILFGGSYPGGQLNDSWVLTNVKGLGGVPEWRQLAASGAMPSPRNGSLAAYNSVSKRLILFGGAASPEVLLNDLWILDLSG